MASKSKAEKPEETKVTEHDRFQAGEEHRRTQTEERLAKKDKSDES